MSNSDFVPGSDPAFKAWLSNFAAKCELYETEIGLSAQQILTIQNQSATFSSNLDTVDAMKLELQGEVAGKDQARKIATTTARNFAKQIKGTPGVTPQILGALGIVSSNSTNPVVPVTNLSANGCSDGINRLKWNRNGNSTGTMFLIESRFENSTIWNFVAAVTKTSFNHENQTPGQTQYYRIKSTRSGITSNPSDPAVVYSNGDNASISIAA